MILLWHLIAFVLGTVLDRIIGDPKQLWHPVIGIGRLISFLEKQLYPKEKNEFMRSFMGGICVQITVLFTALTAFLILFAAYRLHPGAGVIAETIMTCQILAAKSLSDAAHEVDGAFDRGLEEARYAVSMIVGRDTKNLTKTGIICAAVETVAENTSDGVIAPMLYTALGGPVLGFIYKAVNTLDSMIGYKNDRYEHFGTAAARLDDLFNYIPSRLSALFMLAAAAFSGKEYSASEGWRIFKRDRYNHKSPNSAQTESVCAGVLGVRLAGPASYFGKVHNKPYIGDDTRPIEREDIMRSTVLMYRTEDICFLACLLIMISLCIYIYL